MFFRRPNAKLPITTYLRHQPCCNVLTVTSTVVAGCLLLCLCVPSQITARHTHTAAAELSGNAGACKLFSSCSFCCSFHSIITHADDRHGSGVIKYTICTAAEKLPCFSTPDTTLLTVSQVCLRSPADYHLLDGTNLGSGTAVCQLYCFHTAASSVAAEENHPWTCIG